MWNTNIPGSVDLNYLQDTSELESPVVTAVPLPPKYYENKFLDNIEVVGTYKLKGEISYYLMPFYKIKLKCKTNRFTYDTIVIGDECDDEVDARENAFRKANNVITAQYRRDFEDHERMQRKKRPRPTEVPRNIVVEENDAPKPKPVHFEPAPVQESEYEGKFKAIINPIGSYKVESDSITQSMPFFRIWLQCKTHAFAYQTTVVGGEFDDEDEAREEAFRKAYWVMQNQFKIEEENSTRGGYSLKKRVPTRTPLQENSNCKPQSTESKPMHTAFESKFKSMMDALDGTFQLEPHVTDSALPSFKLNLQCKTDTLKFDAVVVGYKKQSEAAARESVFQQVKKYFYERESANAPPVSILENRPNRKYFEGHFTSFISDLGTFALESQPSFFIIHLQCYTNCVALKTTIIGDKFADQEFARQNAFRKAYYILKEKFPAEWLEYQKKLRQFE